ncbi:hypothetical protein APHAL10511_000703 [Amanita phalloides]|nr:hypothetical protein APHAL10511_000703 [Amanita phalloides]
MSTSGGAHHHNPNLGGWGSTSVNPTGSLTSFSDSLSQSRSQYQPGYLMSASQNLNAQQGSPRSDDAPIVQTKAKLNQGLVRGTTSEFGMDSMFQSTTKRQALADEDAPPMTSVTDIPHEIYVDSTSSSPFQPRSPSALFKHRLQPGAGVNGTPHPRHQQPTQEQQAIYVIVFGYPQDRYSVTVEYFKSLGDTTEPDVNTEIANCFKIGYRDPGDAMRAVRKSGEVLCGSYIVGVKWADSAQAEALLGSPSLLRSTHVPPDVSLQPATSDTGMAVDPSAASPHYGTGSFSTAIKLAPSAAAFRKTTIGSGHKAPPPSQPATPSRGWVPSGSGGGAVPTSAPRSMRAEPTTAAPLGGGVETPAKPDVQSRGVLGHVSDLIFGW